VPGPAPGKGETFRWQPVSPPLMAGLKSASVTSTYVRATLAEVATALAALTGEPHPLALPGDGQYDSAG
jgi:hypothetical protein